MKILLHVNGFLPSIGGKELVVHHLATQFKALGHDVVVGGLAGWRAHRSLDCGYPVQRRPMIPLLPNGASRYLWMALARVFGQFDVIHAHITYPSGFIAARTAMLSSAPLVITPHGYDICVVPEIGFGMRLDPDLDAKVRYAVRNAQRVTAISETIHDVLLEVGVEANRIVRIPNGVDLERFSRPSELDMRARLGFPPDSFLVTTIGNFHRRKGHHVIVDAIGRLVQRRPEVRLAIVGAQSEEFSAGVAASGLADYVRFLGSLPIPMPGRTDAVDPLSALLQQSQVYVSAAIDEGAEGLSLALLEGMAARCCPVATRISGNRDIIEHGVNGLLVQPDSADDLAAALCRLIDDPGRLTELRENARRSVDSFGWRAIAERYVALYESVQVKRSGARPSGATTIVRKPRRIRTRI